MSDPITDDLKDDRDELIDRLSAAEKERDEARAILAAQELALTFEQTCLGCAKTLAGALEETRRAERAEAEVRTAQGLVERLADELERLDGINCATGEECDNDFCVDRRVLIEAARKLTPAVGVPGPGAIACGPDQIREDPREPVPDTDGMPDQPHEAVTE